MPDIFSKKKRSEVMSKIKSKWTAPEKKIHGYLKSRKISHKMHPKMTGNPDVLVNGTKLVIFVDGGFWHGRNYDEIKHKLQPFWKKKIENNIIRDRKNNRLLKITGWKVLRFCEEDVKKRPDWCIERIKALSEY